MGFSNAVMNKKSAWMTDELFYSHVTVSRQHETCKTSYKALLYTKQIISVCMFVLRVSLELFIDLSPHLVSTFLGEKGSVVSNSVQFEHKICVILLKSEFASDH